MTPKKTYAVRAGSGDDVYLRFGPGGFYVSIVNAPPSGKVVNSVAIEDGSLAVVGKINNNETTVIGRAGESNIKIMHAVMSRQHVEVKLDSGILLVTDLGSTNGTFFYSENVVFDIEDYIANHPPETGSTSTMDEIHEAFGPTLDDFLKRYKESKSNS